MARPIGYVVWRGPSELDGLPVVLLATGYNNRVANRKTGQMIQTWILRDDQSPLEAVASGADSSICGTCPHRGQGSKQRTCYVDVGRGPMNVWKAYQRGSYAVGMPDNTGRKVRLGAYGDPAAVPIEVWERFTAGATGWTGYTHAWRSRPALQRFLMASCDTEYDRVMAKAAGWRTFRVSMPQFGHAIKLAGEAICPASEEAGAKLQCSTCMACNGKATGRRGDITIQVHGGLAVKSSLKYLNVRLSA